MIYVPSKSERILTDCWPMLDVAHTDFTGDPFVISSQACYHPTGRIRSIALRNVVIGQMSDLWALRVEARFCLLFCRK